MSLTVSPIGAAPVPPANSPANFSSAKLTSLTPTVTDIVQLSTAGQAVVLSPEEVTLDETDTYSQLVKAADNHDPAAGSLLNALDSVPPPKVP